MRYDNDPLYPALNSSMFALIYCYEVLFLGFDVFYTIYIGIHATVQAVLRS